MIERVDLDRPLLLKEKMDVLWGEDKKRDNSNSSRH